MNRVCTGLFIRFFFLLSSFPAIAQNNRFDTIGFYNHLVKNNLQFEQITFNSEWMQWRSNNVLLRDSLLLNNAILYHRLNYTDSSKASLQRIPLESPFTPYSERLYISMLLLHSRLDTLEKVISTNGINYKAGTFFSDADLSLRMLKREDVSVDTGMATYSPGMEKIRKEYETPPRHSPFLAGLYSAVIPGLGKLYLGYKYQAISAFIVNAFLAGEAAESYARAGPGSVRFIISGSIFGIFYGGNILGSILMAKKQRHDYFKQIDHEIFDFHNAVVGKLAY
jgi:hypothetical protein